MASYAKVDITAEARIVVHHGRDGYRLTVFDAKKLRDDLNAAIKDAEDAEKQFETLSIIATRNRT